MNENEPPNGLESPYSFYAFISYRHKDMSWGKWVQRALEAYRLPAELCTELNLPEHVTPVFRDETDLTGGDTVYALLDEKLKESKFLIVICSRELAKKPKYIDYEIEKFLELGNPLNRIIPLVVDGIPKSGDPLTECFPPALLRHGDAVPLAVNVVTDGKRTALLKLVAILLGIDLSALRSHDKVRRQRLYIKAFIAGCIFMLGMSLFFAWQYFSVKQAELHEQMVYAEDLYTDGDRIRAKIICDEVLNSFTPIMDTTIRDNAKEIRFLSTLRPLFSPITHVEAKNAASQLFFDVEGKNIISQAKAAVNIYSLDGDLTSQFRLGNRGIQIATASPDGVHAVLLQTGEDGYSTQLALWDIQKDKQIRVLADSADYDMRDVEKNNFSNLFTVCFSPTGELISVYRSGGYFDENEKLFLFSAENGDVVCSLDGSLLGTRENEGVQSGQVKTFSFLDNDTAYWRSDAYHVFYSLSNNEVTQIPVSVSADVQKLTGRSLFLGRYAPIVLEGKPYGFDFASVMDSDFSPIFTEYGSSIPEYHSYHGKYIVSSFSQNVTLSGIYAAARGKTSVECISNVTAVDATVPNHGASADVAYNEYTQIQYLTGESPVCYAWLTGSTIGKENVLVRLDPEAGTVRFVYGIHGYLELAFLGSLAGRDYIAGQTDTGTELICLNEEGTVLTQKSEISLSTLKETAKISNNEACGRLLCVDHNDYCLFELQPSVRKLTESFDLDEPLFAVDRTGRLVVAADGSRAVWWRNGEYSGERKMDWQPLALGASQGGNWFAAGADCIAAYNADGKTIGAFEGIGSFLPQSVKLSQDGDIVTWLTRNNDNDSNRLYIGCTLHAANLSRNARITYDQVVHWIGTLPVADVYDISPDGSRIAFIENKHLKANSYYRDLTIITAKNGKVEDSLLVKMKNETISPLFTGVRFDSDGNLIAASGHTVRVFKGNDFSLESKITGTSAYTVMPEKLGPKELMFIGDGIDIWNLTKRELLYTLPLNTDENTRALLSADGRWLVLSVKDGCFLYRTRDMKECAQISARSLDVLCFKDQYMIYAADGELYRFDFETK